MDIKKCTLVEKYKGYEIFVDRDTSRFWLINKKRGIEEEFSGIWSAKQYIEKSLVTDVDSVQAIIVSGFFDISLSKVVILSKHANSRYKYKITDSTDIGGDVGKTETEKVGLYPPSPDNLEIYNKLIKLEKKKDGIIYQQQKLVSTLKSSKKLKI